MAEMKLYELEMLRSRIYHGEQELISTLTPEQFFALLSHDYDTGFAAGRKFSVCWQRTGCLLRRLRFCCG